jgi:hypothetical protein
MTMIIIKIVAILKAIGSITRLGECYLRRVVERLDQGLVRSCLAICQRELEHHFYSTFIWLFDASPLQGKPIQLVNYFTIRVTLFVIIRVLPRTLLVRQITKTWTASSKPTQ